MALWFGLGLNGCRAAAHYPTRDGSTAILQAPDAGFGTLRPAIEVDECPQVVVTAAPAAAHIGDTIQVAARATPAGDAGTTTTLAFHWFAGAGSFTDDSAPATDYTCPGRDQAGPQPLQVTVSDGVCAITRAVSVVCFALADGGGPTGAGGAGGDAGPTCAQGQPTTCEGDACNQCTLENCDTLAAVGLRGSAPIAGCDIYVSDAQQQLCQRAYACMRDSHCVQNSDPTRCWCGGVDPEKCATGAVPAAGPCRDAIADAAGTTDPVLIDLRLTDPAFPIGGAINLVTCRSVSCSGLSDPPNPVCRL